MKIEVKINNVIHSVPLSECDTDTRLDHSELLKEQGNKFFKTGKDDDEALLAYKQALYWVSIVDQNQSKGVRARLRANILANIRNWSEPLLEIKYLIRSDVAIKTKVRSISSKRIMKKQYFQQQKPLI